MAMETVSDVPMYSAARNGGEIAEPSYRVGEIERLKHA
jgi:hypothetical protein